MTKRTELGFAIPRSVMIGVGDSRFRFLSIIPFPNQSGTISVGLRPGGGVSEFLNPGRFGPRSQVELVD